MDDWEKFNETTLPEKEEFYSNLNMEDITDVFDDVFDDVFENFRKMCLKIYHLDPVKFVSAHVVAWQAALKKTEVKLELLNDIDMILMNKKGVRGGMCHAIHWYAKANNKYMKDYDKNK